MRFSSFRFVGSLFSIAVACVSFVALGCDEAKLTPATADAGCGEPKLEYPCAAQASGTPGCDGELDSGPALGHSSVLDGSFPANCTVVVYDPVPDEDLQCSQLGTCTCNQNDAGAFGWACRE